MLRMFRTINGQVEQIQKPENGSWLCLSEPTDVELASVAQETGIDLADLRAPLDDEERSRVDVEDDYTMIIVDIPTVEERGGRDWYETIPLSIIITQSMIITVCMQDTPVLHPFMEGTIRGFNTYMKTRFILQILYRNATMYLRYLRIIDRDGQHLQRRSCEHDRRLRVDRVEQPEQRDAHLHHHLHHAVDTDVDLLHVRHELPARHVGHAVVRQAVGLRGDHPDLTGAFGNRHLVPYSFTHVQVDCASPAGGPAAGA